MARPGYGGHQRWIFTDAIDGMVRPIQKCDDQNVFLCNVRNACERTPGQTYSTKRGNTYRLLACND